MSSDKVNKIANYNQMMAWLTRPEAPKEQFSDRSDFAIGGGAIEGEDLGSREGYGRPKVDIPGLDQKVEELFKENLSNNQVLQKINEIPEYKDVNIGTVKRIKKEKGLGGQREQLFSSQAEKYNRLKALIEESNKNLDFVEMQSLRETVGLPKKVAQTDYENYKKFNIPKLDTAPDKVTKAFNKIINNPNIPVEQVFDLSSTIAKQTGLSNSTTSNILNTLPEYQEFIPVRDRLSKPASKASLIKKIQSGEKITLGDVMNIVDQQPITGTSLSGTNTPERFIFNSVKRHIDQGGDKIEWVKAPGTFDESGKVTDANAVFRYKGKDYDYFELLQNGRKIDDFKEVYKSYDEMKDLLSREVTNPLTKEKTTFKDLMSEAYAKGGFSESLNPYQIDHFGSVKNEPFSNLRILPTRINQAAGSITSAAQRATTGVFTKKGKEWTPTQSKLYLQKSGYNFTKDINKLFNDEVKLANDILVKGRKLRKVSDIGKEAAKKKFTQLLDIEGIKRASEIDRPEFALQGEMFKNFNERLSKLTGTPTAEVKKDVSNVTKVINEMSSKMNSGMDPVLLAKFVKAQAQDIAEFGSKYGGDSLGFVGKSLAGLDLPIMQVMFSSMQDWEQDSPLWVTLPAAFTDEVSQAFNLYQKTGGKAKEFGKFLASSFVPRAARSPLFKAVSKVGKVGSVATPLLEAGQEAYKFKKMKGMLPEIARQFNIPIEIARKGFENYIRSTIPQDLAGQGLDETTVPESPGLPGLLRTFQDIGSFLNLSESPYKDPNAMEDIIVPKAKPSLDERNFVAEGGRIGFADGPKDPKKGLGSLSKRNFLKMLTVIPAGIMAIRGGPNLLKKAKPVVETFKNAPAHFIGLVNKIRALGKIVDPKKLLYSEQDRYKTVYDYGDYRMFETPDGKVQIQKQKLVETDYGDGIVSEEYMSYDPKSPKFNKKGEKIEGEYDEVYEENTTYADQYGEMTNVEEGVELDTIKEGTYSKEELEQLIIEQIEDSIKKGKK